MSTGDRDWIQWWIFMQFCLALILIFSNYGWRKILNTYFSCRAVLRMAPAITVEENESSRCAVVQRPIKKDRFLMSSESSSLDANFIVNRPRFLTIASFLSILTLLYVQFVSMMNLRAVPFRLDSRFYIHLHLDNGTVWYRNGLRSDMMEKAYYSISFSRGADATWRQKRSDRYIRQGSGIHILVTSYTYRITQARFTQTRLSSLRRSLYYSCMARVNRENFVFYSYSRLEWHKVERGDNVGDVWVIDTQ